MQQHNRRSKTGEDSYVKLERLDGTITILGDITAKTASDFRRALRILERNKKVKKIIVEINTHGGDIEAGFAIIDSIELSKKDVVTRVTGCAYSMGSLILAAGDHREALPSSIIMIHQGSYRFSSTFDEIKIESAECERMEKLCNDTLDRLTNKKSGYWEGRHQGKNLYLTAEQSLAECIIDSIMGASKP